ncbi:MAG: disulfide bond formation protein B [Methylocystis sp.]|nr:disulfide bond formation protein B [Methylocystis sp.]MBI3274564.1 disulfide bond formation protein B [Methylocystis sp.]
MDRPRQLTPRSAALLIAAVAAATIVGAWIFEALGYLPCELCLAQRIPYYVGIPLALLAALVAHRGAERLARAGLAALALLFVAGAALALYHSGVELKLWQGPSDCAGTLAKARSAEDFMDQLRHVKVARCDEPALWVLGLTLSNWNVAISFALAALAGRAAWRARS